MKKFSDKKISNGFSFSKNKLEDSDIFEYENEQYMAIVVVEKDGISYSLACKLDDEEKCDEHYIFSYSGDSGFAKITEQKILDYIFPDLQSRLKHVLKENGIKY